MKLEFPFPEASTEARSVSYRLIGLVLGWLSVEAGLLLIGFLLNSESGNIWLVLIWPVLSFCGVIGYSIPAICQSVSRWQQGKRGPEAT